MSLLNKGSQNITFRYEHPTTGEEFNTLLRGVLKPGVYTGQSGLIAYNTGSSITVNPYAVVINTGSDKTIAVQATGSFTETISPVSTQDYFYATYTYAEATNNYLDFYVRAVGASAVTNEIIFGTINSLSGVITSVNTNGQTKGLFNSNGDITADKNLRVDGDAMVTGTLTGTLAITGIVSADTINEKTLNNGTDVEGNLHRDGYSKGHIGQPYTHTGNGSLTNNSRNYVNGTGGRIQLTLPVTAAVGDLITIKDIGSRGWEILQNAGQNIIIFNQSTIPGTTGYIQSKTGYASIELECVVADTTWIAKNVRDMWQMKGYHLGGFISATVTVIEDLTFATEASVVITATLDTAKYEGAGVSSNSKGYIMGGYTTGATAVIEDLNFANEASVVITATLDTATREPAGVSSNSKGYIMGGFTTGATAVIEGLTFANEASVVITATLDTAKRGPVGVSSNSKGYCMGGDTGSVTAVIEDLTFATEASVVITATLDTAKNYGTGVSSNLKGYIMGGDTGSVTTVIEDLNFATEASVAITATLDTAKKFGAGVSSNSKGYIMGGFTSVNVAVIEDLTFTTETSVVITATLDTAKSGGTGVQGYN